MRLVTFSNGAGPLRAGALVNDDTMVADLQMSFEERTGKPSPYLESVLAMAEGGAEALALAYDQLAYARRTGNVMLPAGGVKLHAPIPRPQQMRDFLCFEKHLLQGFAAARKVRAAQSDDPDTAMREMEKNGVFTISPTWYERPIFYHPNRLNVVGPDEDILWPSYCDILDFELEFGCYIGKQGKDIARDQALEHVFGYTIFNDFSARDEQVKDMPGQLGPGKGKDFDTANAMGPCLVTSDEIKNPYDLSMVVRVDGEEWGRGSSGEMHWRFEDCISHVSRSETIYPGEFFGSGTVGNGCGMEQMRFLTPGSVVELEVEGIGVLRNRVVRRQ